MFHEKGIGYFFINKWVINLDWYCGFKRIAYAIRKAKF
jgi:hypothetical protein